MCEDEILSMTKQEIQFKLAKTLKELPTFCDYPECFVQYIEHYHIDRDTLTFRKPEEKD